MGSYEDRTYLCRAHPLGVAHGLLGACGVALCCRLPRSANPSLGEAAPCSFKLPQEYCCQGILPVHGKTCCWKKLVISTLVIMVFGPWMRVSKTGQCNCHTICCFICVLFSLVASLTEIKHDLAMIVAVSWCWAWLPVVESNTIFYGPGPVCIGNQTSAVSPLGTGSG